MGLPTLRTLLVQLTWVHALVSLFSTAAALRLPRPGVLSQGRAGSLADLGRSRVPKCLTQRWFTQRLDQFHFSTDSPTFQQRYFICTKFWRTNDEKPGPIFFYAGNEGSIETYIENTGLMWENAERFGALVLFAEHRYYGQTEPFGKDSWSKDPSYLTVEQALADYAELLWNITQTTPGARDSPVIAFGGSYGGMLAAWMRLKYPHLVTGAIAASAPLASFPSAVPAGSEEDEFQPSTFWEVVTFDATADAGAAPDCADNVRAAFRALFALGATAVGRGQLKELFRLCDALDGPEDVEALAYWAQGAFDAMAMGNYPYPSTYIAGEVGAPLPAWPMRAACSHMTFASRGPGFGDNDYEGKGGLLGGGAAGKPTSKQLLEGLRYAAGVLYNVTGRTLCFGLDTAGPAAGNSGPWDYQFCTELMGQEQPYYPTNGKTDMFWDQGPFDLKAIGEHCRKAWGVEPRPHHCPITYGGRDLRYASNIVLSNGLYDPWSVFGIMDDINESVVALIVPEGAHHLDLMFSHPDDPASVRIVREEELKHVEAWVAEHRRKTRQQRRRSRGGWRGRAAVAAAAGARARA